MGQAYSTYITSNSGELRQKVILMKRATVIDSSGAPANAWMPFARVPAMVEPVSGREYWSASQSNREGTVRVTIRYMDGIEDAMRIVFDTRDRRKIFEVVSPPINVRERNEYIQFMCNIIEAGNDEGGLR